MCSGMILPYRLPFLSLLPCALADLYVNIDGERHTIIHIMISPDME